MNHENTNNLTCHALQAQKAGQRLGADQLFNLNLDFILAAPYTALDLFLNIAGPNADEGLLVVVSNGLDGAGVLAGLGLVSRANAPIQAGQMVGLLQLAQGVCPIGFQFNQGAADFLNVYLQSADTNET